MLASIKWIPKVSRKQDPYQTPIIDHLIQEGVDIGHFKNYLKQYGNILIQGAAFEAFQLHQSNEFPKIKTTAEALNQGQQCLSSFLKRLYAEDEIFRSKNRLNKQPDEDIL